MGVRDDMLSELETRVDITENATFLGHPCVLHGLPASRATKVAMLHETMSKAGRAPRHGLEHAVIYAAMFGLYDEEGDRIFRGAKDADALLHQGRMGELTEVTNRIIELSGIDLEDEDEDDREALKKRSEDD